MVAYCSVPKCFSHKREVRLFSFPKNDEKRMHWAKILGVDSVSKGNKVCAKHFRGKDILKKSGRLKQESNPSPMKDNNMYWYCRPNLKEARSVHQSPSWDIHDQCFRSANIRLQPDIATPLTMQNPIQCKQNRMLKLKKTFSVTKTKTDNNIAQIRQDIKWDYEPIENLNSTSYSLINYYKKQYNKERRARMKAEKENCYITDGLKIIIAELKTHELNDKCSKLLERMREYLDAEGIVSHKDSEGESEADPDEFEIVQDENGVRYQILGVEEVSENEDEGYNRIEDSSDDVKDSKESTIHRSSEGPDKIRKHANVNNVNTHSRIEQIKLLGKNEENDGSVGSTVGIISENVPLNAGENKQKEKYRYGNLTDEKSDVTIDEGVQRRSRKRRR